MKEKILEGLFLFNKLTTETNIQQNIPKFMGYDTWFALRGAFAMEYSKMGVFKYKHKFSGIKRFMEEISFMKINEDASHHCDVLCLDSAFDRYNEIGFSPYVKSIVTNLENQYTCSQLSILSLKSYSSKHQHNFFDYNTFVPLPSFIKYSNDEETVNKRAANSEDIFDNTEFTKELIENKQLMASLTIALKYTYPEVTRYISAYEKAFDFFTPKVMLCIAHDMPQVYTALMVAKRRNIKVVEAVHGISGDSFYPNHYTFPDKICTYGKKDYGNFIRGGVPADYLEITGNARSQAAQPKPFSKKENYTVLWLSQGDSYPLEHNKKVISVIFEWARKQPNISLIVRLHPDDRLHFLYHLSAKRAKNITITKGTSLLSDIKQAAVVITKNSTAGIDAVSYGKPLLIEWVFESPDIFYNEYFPTFHDESSLDHAFEEVLSKNSWYAQRGKELLDNFSVDHGNGGKNIAEVVRRLMNIQKRYRGITYETNKQQPDRK